jgi:VCBS repeat-containing protein
MFDRKPEKTLRIASVCFLLICSAAIASIPRANNDRYFTDEDTEISFNVILNDFDADIPGADGEALAVFAFDSPRNGIITSFSPDGSFTYLPDLNFNGVETFEYLLTDGVGHFDEGLVTIIVNEVNDDPEVVDDLLIIDEDTTGTTGNVLDNDSDDDNDPLQIVGFTSPTNGQMRYNGDGTFTYVPDRDFFGADTFNYTVNDGEGGIIEGAINIIVFGINDSPVAQNDNFDTDENVELEQAAPGVLDNDTDDDEGDELTATLVDGPAVVDFNGVGQSPGTLLFNLDGSFRYTPPHNVVGVATFTYTVNDSFDDSNVATVTIDIGEINIDPVARPDFTATPENTTVTINVLANDTDGNVDDQLFVIDLPDLPDNGLVGFDTGGNLTYTPLFAFSGVDTFDYEVSDGRGGRTVATVTINVLAVNFPPTATADSAVTSEDTEVTIDVLANDVDVNDSDVLALVDFTEPVHGEVLFSGNQLTYTPDPGYNGNDSFTYRITDGQLIVGPATVSIFISSVNDDPIGVDDTIETVEDVAGGLVITYGILLANDTDPDGDTLTVFTFEQPGNGALENNAAGLFFTYTPDLDFSGDDTFTYTVTDGRGEPATATVAITVDEVNDAPVANDDVAFVQEDDEVTISVLGNDEDLDTDDQLFISEIPIVSAPEHGEVTINGTTVTYTPVPNYNGPDTFDYTISDGNGGTATATVTVNVAAINDPPVARDDAYEAVSSVELVVAAADGVLFNDSDVEGDALTAILATPTTSGTLALAADGSLTYTAVPGFSGDDTFTYIAVGGTSGSEEATVTITVVNQVPFANDDFFSVNGGEVLNVTVAGTLGDGVLANDHDQDADALTAILVSGPSNGALLFNADGTFQYTPNPGTGGEDTFTYTAFDGLDESSSATVTITVSPTHEPIANDDFFNVDEDGTLAVADDANDIVEGNDTDGDGDTLIAQLVSPPQNGAFAFNSSGSFSYTPNPDFFGEDTFTYIVSDGVNDSNTATVTITVDPVNDPPEAVADAISTPQDEAVVIDVLANDTDTEADELFITDVTTTVPTKGTVTLLNDNTLLYTPNASAVGADTFSYTIEDLTAVGSSTATVNVLIVGVANAPEAVDDEVTINEDAVDTVIAAAANDSDADGDSLTATIETGPGSGSVTVNVIAGDPASFSFTYNPDLNFEGEDSFAYTISDGFNVSEVATVTITIDAVNDLPIAVDDLAVTLEDESVAINVLTNDTDTENDTLTVSGITQPAPAVGQLTLANNVITFTPAAGFTGVTMFDYEIVDEQAPAGGSEVIGTVTVVVIAVTHAPVAVDDGYAVAEDTLLTVTAGDKLTLNDSDADNDTLNALLETTPQNGTLTLASDGTFTYQPDTDFNGDDSFTYVVTDGFNLSEVATVTITVTEVNDDPVAEDDNAVTLDGEAVTVDVLGNDGDVDTADQLLITSVTQPVSGSAQVEITNGGTNLSYVSVPGFFNDETTFDTFTYTVSDFHAGTNSATVTVLVLLNNEAPVAVDDDAETTGVAPVTVNLVANDTDLDDTIDVAELSITQAASNGAVVDNNDGTVTYTATANFVGTDVFQYVVRDQVGAISNAATVTITVENPNQPPTANDVATTIDEDATADDLDIAFNDTDDSSIVTSTITIVDQPANGTLLNNSNGTVDYTPNADFLGTDTFTYTIDDADGATSNTATVTITVDPVNDNPVGVDDRFAIADGSSVAFPVLDNDTDIENDLLFVSSITVEPASTNGQVEITGNGQTVTFQALPGFDGTVTFTYEVSDNSGATDTAQVTIRVFASNDAPVAMPDAVDANIATAVDIDVTGNDTDGDGSVDLTSVIVTADPVFGVTGAPNNGVITYTPGAGFEGTDSFRYVVRDNEGKLSNEAVVTITVAGDAPLVVVQDDTATASQGVALAISVTENDTAAAGLALGTVVIVAGPTDGNITNVSATGVVTYQSDADFAGVDTFQYIISDANNAVSAPATVTVTVFTVNSDPIAIDDPAETDEGVAVDIAVLNNDIADFDTALAPTSIVISDETNGTAVANDDGTVTFTPTAPFPAVGSFKYTVSDNVGRTSAAATVTITLNDAPVAVADTLATDEDTAVAIDVLDNDTDDSAVDPTTVEITDLPDNGTVAVDGVTGVVTYTPSLNFNGVDTFKYTVEDDDGLISNEITVTVTVNAVNNPPVALADTAITDEDSAAITIAVAFNDSDRDGAVNKDSIVITAAPANGILVVKNDGSGEVTYTPNPGTSGVDTFTYTVADDSGERSNETTVTITVFNIDLDPVAVDDAATTDEGVTVTIDVTANDTLDPDGGATFDTSSFVFVQGAKGTASATNGVVTYAPIGTNVGEDTFTYTVKDNTGRISNAATVTVTINDLPTVVDSVVATNEDVVAAGIDLVALATDTDGTIVANSVVVTVQPATGTLVVVDGIAAFTPAQDDNTNVLFKFTIADNNEAVSNEATVDIVVNPVNDKPVAAADTAQTDEEIGVAIALSSNDTDVDGNLDTGTIVITLAPIDGILTVPAAGSVTYTPDPAFTGTDTFEYTIEDTNSLRSDPVAVTITVLPVNENPGAVDDTANTNENTDVVIDILVNDDFDAAASAIESSVTLSNQSSGTTSVNAVTGAVTFTPTPDFAGNGSFQYTVKDNLGRMSNTATVTITINDAPVANDDGASTTSGTAITINVIDNDTDSDGTVTSTSVTVLSGPDNGAFIDNDDGTVTYTPNGGFDGIDSFTYTVMDDDLATSNTATVSVLTITTGGTAIPPTVAADAATTIEDTSIQIDVLANDTGGDPNTVIIVAAPTAGVAGVNADGTITYTPNQNSTAGDTVDYVVASVGGAFSTIATVTITVTAVNDLPIAIEDIAQIDSGMLISIDVLDNDSDVETATAALTLFDVSQPRNGTAVINGTAIDYTPAATFVGTDTFTYTVEDADGGRNTATITVNVVGALLAAPDATVFIGFDTPRVRHGDSFEVLVFVREDTAAGGFLGGPIDVGFSALVGFDNSEISTPADAIVNPFTDIQPTTGTAEALNINELKGQTNRTPFGNSEYVLYARIPFTANDAGTATFTPVDGATGLVLTDATTTDIKFIANSIEVVNFGDSDSDSDVDTVDLTAFLATYPSESGDAVFDDIFDFDSDSDIDFNDLTAMIAAIGTTYNARGGGREVAELLASVILDRPLAPVQVGDVFQIRVLVQEDTDLADGFRGGPLDLFFDTDHVAYHGNFDTGQIIQAPYNAFLTNGYLEDGHIDDLGGLAIQSGLGNGTTVTYAVLTFEATESGSAIFHVGAGESGFALTPPLGQIDTDEIFYGNAVVVQIEDESVDTDAGSWTFALDADGAELFIGMASGASDFYDVAHDWFGNGSAVLEIATGDLLRDIRDDADSARWQLRVHATTDTAVSWDSTAVPAGGLLLRQTDAFGDPVTAGISMSTVSSVTVDAGELVWFEIVYGGVSFDLTLANGWNMISVPVLPFDNAAAAVLQGEASGPAWRWSGAYVASATIDPKVGYWVYRMGDAVVITIYGAPVADTSVAVDTDWNLIGPVASPPFAPVPLDAQPVDALDTAIWIYRDGRYQAVNSLLPGFGHWLRATTTATLTP